MVARAATRMKRVKSGVTRLVLTMLILQCCIVSTSFAKNVLQLGLTESERVQCVELRYERSHFSLTGSMQTIFMIYKELSISFLILCYMLTFLQITEDPAWRDGSTSQFIQLF